MQGKKDYQEKPVRQFPVERAYPRQQFLRASERRDRFGFPLSPYQGLLWESGQKSIDPVVFSKLCPVGYLENIIGDPKLIDHCSMCLDILFFIGYDIDEEIPWHSTISRTRQLFPEEVSEQVFVKVLSMCVEKGKVPGHTQAIDSAPVKANASMDTLELKVSEEDLDEHLQKINTIGIEQANNPPERTFSVRAGVMHLSAIAYNLKKYLKFVQNRSKSGLAQVALAALTKKSVDRLFGGFTKHLKSASQI